MSLVLVTPPTSEPVALADLKLHLRVDSTDEDDLIAGMNAGARDYAETFIQAAIPYPQTWDYTLDAFPSDGVIRLPLGQVTAITSLTYVATDGASTLLSPALYAPNLPTGPKALRGYIIPAYQQHWPSTRNVASGVIVRFVAGYLGTALPLASLTQAAGVATATVIAGHGLTNLQMVTIAGAAQAGYNGSFTATVISSTVFTFPVAAGTVSPATGTVTATPDPVPTLLKVCIKEHVRANYSRGAEDRVEIMQWVDRNLWAYKSF